MSQMLCIDEQMIPFKGNSALQQYLPSKPHKYGYKVFILCSNKGVIYEFELYTGKIQPADDASDLGASLNIVLRLAKIIPTDKHYLLYFDNWFTSLPLVCHLAKSKIFCLGTVRSNRLLGCDLSSDIKKRKTAASRKGRRSTSLDKAFEAKKARGHASKAIPQQAVRNDNVDHFPIYKEKRGKCKLPGCNSRPYFFCSKCQVHLCIARSKNCFLNFHKT